MAERLDEYFGRNTFNEQSMEERLPKKIYQSLKKIIETGEEMDSQIAEVVANAMKDWAIERGATHYTHWFQPMTGITAEKHDSFISPAANGRILMEFSGKELIKGESDASSFPSGGLRATFEARGYTAWDCTSPAFLREDAGGVTLCIPTAFCSYAGEALDKKTPLLRSMEALSEQAVRMLHLFGKKEVKSVICSVGAEQEYFIIDRNKYLQREDLIFTGRTLFGAMPPKGQEMDDHYFGSIKERIASFMKELNEELWKLGILAKTQHNEAAPAQHELAPIYSTANIATDHNQLIMESMRRIANRHGLACLLHEKPFAGVNGSGKHNNWSLITDTGENLFNPGKKPHENLQFLLFFAAVLKAVDDHAEILRLSASNPGNDHRLGANEAPPAVISVFIGEQMEDILAQLMENGEATSSKKGGKLNTGVHTLPFIKKDATDRNRTSPFAFTGNKFEFRMVASSQSIGGTNSVLNSIMADTLSKMADELEQAENFDTALKELISRTIREHQRIVFNGNGYSDEWTAEAERRGLPNLRTFVDAIPALLYDKTVQMFERQKVLSYAELVSRSEINYEIYAKAINIEARTMCEMATKLYIPAVIKYVKILAEAVNAVKSASAEASVEVQNDLLVKCSELLVKTRSANVVLNEKIRIASEIECLMEKANYIKNEVVPSMKNLRSPIDELEVIVDKELWPVPSYGDMLFEI